MIHNKISQNGILIREEFIDLENQTFVAKEFDVVVENRSLTENEIVSYRPQPLNRDGIYATLNAVLGLWSLEDAANAAGLNPEHLIAEAQAWAAASGV